MPLSTTEFKLLIIEDNLGDLLLIKEYLKKIFQTQLYIMQAHLQKLLNF